MLYKNIQSVVLSSDVDTKFFEINLWGSEGDISAPFLFIICQYHELKSSIDCNVKQRQIRSHPTTYITDMDYANGIAITSDSLQNINQLLIKIEDGAKEIGLKINKIEYMIFNIKENHNLTNKHE